MALSRNSLFSGINMFKSSASLFAILALSFTSFAVSQDGVDGTIVRPMTVDAKFKGCKVAKPGEYRVTDGDLIELEYSYPVVPETIPDKVSYNQTLNGAVKLSPLGIRNVTTPSLVGIGTIALCLDANQEGTDKVTLIIDGAEYEYTFNVEAMEKAGDAKAVLCSATYSAQQVPGAVIIFAAGVHPTPGYKTYFEELPITVFPPQHRLMHVKPKGMVAQVITPFMVETSFPAEDKIDEVIVHDANGEHKVPVEQVPDIK